MDMYFCHNYVLQIGDMYEEIDQYILINKNEELDDVDYCESEEIDIFKGNAHEHSDMDSENASGNPNIGRFDESDSDDDTTEHRPLRHN